MKKKTYLAPTVFVSAFPISKVVWLMFFEVESASEDRFLKKGLAYIFESCHSKVNYD